MDNRYQSVDLKLDLANLDSCNFKGLETSNFALNHYGEADVAMFDFTSMYAAENACRAKRIIGSLEARTCNCCNSNCDNHCQPCKKMKSDILSQPSDKDFFDNNGLLLTGLVGDSLLEPFWPTGSGCARGFLSAMDAAWMARQWAIKQCNTIKNEEAILSVLSERESIYRLLAQTKSENLSQNYTLNTINPITRYPNLNSTTMLPHQCKHLLYDGVAPSTGVEYRKKTLAAKRLRRATIATTNPFSSEILDKKGHLNNRASRIIDEVIEDSSIAATQAFEMSLATFDENYQSLITSNGDDIKESISNSSDLFPSSAPSRGQQAFYDLASSPSASNLATLGKSRAKDIESALRHRRQQQMVYQRPNEPQIAIHQKAQQQYVHHMKQQLQNKAAWFLESQPNSSSTISSASSNSSSFANRIKDLEAKLYAASGISYCDGEDMRNFEKTVVARSGSHVLETASNLEQILNPKYQEAKLKEKIKKTIIKDKNVKYASKLTKDDWNVKVWDKPGELITRSMMKSCSIINNYNHEHHHFCDNPYIFVPKFVKNDYKTDSVSCLIWFLLLFFFPVFCYFSYFCDIVNE